jgi:hypothetical protein
MKKHCDYGLLSEAVHKAVLMQNLESKGIKVIAIQNVSRGALFNPVRMYRVKFIKRRGHEIDGCYHVGHVLFGVMFGHIRFTRQYERKDPPVW